MTPGARIAAAIEVVEEIEARKRPAADALKEWGLSHRFAGAKDRAAIASLVFDAQRKRASSAFIMGDETPRASVLGALRQLRGMSAKRWRRSVRRGTCATPTQQWRNRTFRPPISPKRQVLSRAIFPRGWSPLGRGLRTGRRRRDERARHARTCRSARQHIKNDAREGVASLAHLHAAPTPYSPSGLRLPLTPDGRGPALAAEPAYIKGLAEIQDEGSQLAAILALAKPGEQVLDLCAARAAKPWRLQRRCKTKVRSMRPTAMGQD